MRTTTQKRSAARLLAAALFASTSLASPAIAAPPASEPPQPTVSRRVSAAPELAGRNVEEVRILGNKRVPTSAIRNLIRTRTGQPLDPATVEEDYQRIFRTLRRFSNVEAKVEATSRGGVIVVFEVTEQQQISKIEIQGNRHVDESAIRGILDVNVGESIDPFRISVARTSIANLYRDRNFPFAHVNIAQKPLQERGELIFEVVEGPNVRVRRVSIKGAKSFTEDKLQQQIKTKSWVFVLSAGRYDPELIDEDVAALRRFYESKGFFDVRVGRKIIWSKDLSEVEVSFRVEEGPRYQVERVTFEFEGGKQNLTDAQLRKDLKLQPGRSFDADLVRRDVRQIVRAYAPLGYIYAPDAEDPAYLTVEPKTVFLADPGRLELVYTIREGERFQYGDVIIKGNYKSQDKLVLRELRFTPGELYDSGKVQDAAERLRGTGFFENATITPVGSEPGKRSLLVQVAEAKTARFNISAGVNTNGGLGAGIVYTQNNFDIGNAPDRWKDILSERSFTGAGQLFRLSLEPGTEQSNASVLFSEPFLLDQPYRLTLEGYIRDRERLHYDDQRMGGRVSLGRRFGYQWAATVGLRGEDVEISSIDDRPLRAFEYLEEEGHSTLTSATFSVKRDTTNPGALKTQGTVANASVELFGALGGDYTFQKYTVDWDGYWTLREDLVERKTVLGLHGNFGYITGDSVFFERFYMGGIGSMRGFSFRGISPRSGLDDDAIGGDFLLSGSAEVGFPLAGENLRGVVFADAGTVEEDFELGTIRTAVGAGIRLTLPFMGQAPVAIDFGLPITKDDEDDTQVISFSFGFIQ